MVVNYSPHDEYDDVIFYIKKNAGTKEILMEKWNNNKTFYIRYSNFWSVFEDKYELQYSEIQSFTQLKLEEVVNSKGYKTLDNMMKT